jgi:hypothetical protein
VVASQLKEREGLLSTVESDKTFKSVDVHL